MVFGLAQITSSFTTEILKTQYDNLNIDVHVPEPSSIALLGMAILGFAWVAWRKRA
jgi:PEP-CTERM motif